MESNQYHSGDRGDSSLLGDALLDLVMGCFLVRASDCCTFRVFQEMEKKCLSDFLPLSLLLLSFSLLQKIPSFPLMVLFL